MCLLCMHLYFQSNFQLIFVNCAIAGRFVDYVEPLKAAFRDRKFVVRDIAYDASKAGGVDGAIEAGEAEMAHMRSVSLRWCRAHFGEAYAAWLHLKVIQAFVESVLRYGLPVDFSTFLMKPNVKIADKDMRTRLTKAILTVRPELQLKNASLMEDDEEGGGDDADILPYVCLKFPILGKAEA
jgi:V-type H+-transporting ATPase subunit C